MQKYTETVLNRDYIFIIVPIWMKVLVRLLKRSFCGARWYMRQSGFVSLSVIPACRSVVQTGFERHSGKKT